MNPGKEYVVCTYASLEGLGGVLIQEGNVICYESRKLKDHEKKYATHDLELETIVHAMRIWRHYLLNSIFELRLDHHNLKYLFEYPNLNAHQARWMGFLSEFHFEIKHIKDK